MSIRFEACDKALTAFAGLPLITKAISHLDLERLLSPCLPAGKIAGKASSFDKFEGLCLGFVCGAECLADMEHLGNDSGFAALNKHVYAPNSYGDFLREFTDVQCRLLNDRLIETSLRMRSVLFPKDDEFILDLDSTPHPQHGKKMEGVEVNFKNITCLDSIEAFDNKGFQYWMNVRNGATFTSNTCSEIIDAVFRKVSKKKGYKRRSRADSGFCNQEYFHACKTAGVEFVTTMRANMFNPIASTVDKWERCSKKIKFYDGRECEIGHTLYWPEGYPQALRVVAIRAKKVEEQQTLLDDNYDYYAWVTNMGQHVMSDENILLFYRGRGNAENFIKELKGNFDLSHFPCLKLVANKAYGLIGSFAYNLVRFLAFISDPKKPRFAKWTRLRSIYLCAQVVRHAKTTTLRLMKHQLEEVQILQERINIKFIGMVWCQNESPPDF